MFCFANQFACVSRCLPQQENVSALAPLLINQTIFLLSEYRQASDWQELAHNSTCPIVTCPEPEVALVVIFRYLCSFHVEPAALRVRRVRLDHSEDVITERLNVAQTRISDRCVVSR